MYLWNALGNVFEKKIQWNFLQILNCDSTEIFMYL